MLFSLLLLSIVEGISEFLPVSSTGHMILLSHWLNMNEPFIQSFIIVIQFGAILAVLGVEPSYFKQSLQHPFGKQNRALVIAMLPVLGVGFLLKDAIKAIFTPQVVFMGLIVGGIMLILSDALIPKASSNTNAPKVSYWQAVMVGCWQCLSLWPGMSRSAMTIIGGMVSGLNRVSAASFSFVLAFPIMAIICGYELSSSWPSATAIEWWLMLGGIATSFFVARLTMRWFLGVVHRWGLTAFGVYRIALGGIGWVFFT